MRCPLAGRRGAIARGNPPGLPGDGNHGRGVAGVFGRLCRVDQHFHGGLRVQAGHQLGAVAQGADGLAQQAPPELDPAAQPGRPPRYGRVLGGQVLSALGADQSAFGLSRLEGHLPGVDQPPGLATASGDSSAARSKAAAAAANPLRRLARRAEASSSPAISWSVPKQAAARCQVRRSVSAAPVSTWARAR